jgi:hypothetical protein
MASLVTHLIGLAIKDGLVQNQIKAYAAAEIVKYPKLVPYEAPLLALLDEAITFAIAKLPSLG